MWTDDLADQAPLIDPNSSSQRRARAARRKAARREARAARAEDQYRRLRPWCYRHAYNGVHPFNGPTADPTAEQSEQASEHAA